MPVPVLCRTGFLSPPPCRSAGTGSLGARGSGCTPGGLLAAPFLARLVWGGAQRGGRGAVDSRRQRSWSWCQLELEIFGWNPHRTRWGRQYARDLHSLGNLQSRRPSLRSGVTGFPIEKKNGVKNWGRGENLSMRLRFCFVLKIGQLRPREGLICPRRS